MSLEAAIARMEEEVDSFAQGTKTQPKPGTPDWFVLRALALGLSHLKRMRQLSLDTDPPAAERHYRECQALLKQIDVPPAEEIAPEAPPT